MRIAVVGCGHICNQYGKHIANYPDELEIAGAMDLDPARAAGFAAEYGGGTYKDFDAVLADDSVDIVLDLTIHHAHFDLNSRALKAGKHVYTEKPMALNFEQARELVRLSKETGRRLGTAPATFLGEGIQTTARFLETDRLGPLRLVYAEVNWAQIERWISSPAAYFTVGPLLDVGVYAITALVYLLGPVRNVWGSSHILKNPRFDQKGMEFPVTAPDFTVGMMEFECGVVARVTTNYYVNSKKMRHLRGLEFHGDDGSLITGCYHNFNPECRFHPYGEGAREVPLLREPTTGMDRALGIADMVAAIRENRPHRACPEQAAHVIEIMEGLQRSSDESQRVEIHSNFAKPELMDWAKEAKLLIRENE